MAELVHQPGGNRVLGCSLQEYTSTEIKFYHAEATIYWHLSVISNPYGAFRAESMELFLLGVWFPPTQIMLLWVPGGKVRWSVERSTRQCFGTSGSAQEGSRAMMETDAWQEMADAQESWQRRGSAQPNWHTGALPMDPSLYLWERNVAAGSALCEEMMGRTNSVLLLLLWPHLYSRG